MTAAKARRLVRSALRRTIGRRLSRLRTTCRRSDMRGRVCRIRLRRGAVRFNGNVRVWYAVEGAATRWYYGVNLVRRARSCPAGGRCSRRIRRVERLGGTVRVRSQASATAAPFVCRVVRARR